MADFSVQKVIPSHSLEVLKAPSNLKALTYGNVSHTSDEFKATQPTAPDKRSNGKFDLDVAVDNFTHAFTEGLKNTFKPQNLAMMAGFAAVGLALAPFTVGASLLLTVVGPLIAYAPSVLDATGKIMEGVKTGNGDLFEQAATPLGNAAGNLAVDIGLGAGLAKVGGNLMKLIPTKAIEALPSPHFETFQTQLAQSNVDIDTLLADTLKPEHAAGAGTGATFFNINHPDFANYGIKVLDEAVPFFRNSSQKKIYQQKQDWASSMVKGMFGPPSAEKRLETILPKLADGIELEALPTKIGELTAHAHDAILVKSKKGDVIAIIQNKVPGKGLNSLVPSQCNLTTVARRTDEDIAQFFKAVTPEDLKKLYDSPAVQKALASQNPTAEEWETLANTVIPTLSNEFKALARERSWSSSAFTSTDAHKAVEFIQRYDTYQKDYLAFTEGLARYPKDTVHQFVSEGKILQERGVQIDIDRHSDNILHNFPNETNPKGSIGMVDLDEFSTKIDLHHHYDPHQMLLMLLGKHQLSKYALPEFVIAPHYREAMQRNLSTFMSHYKDALVENGIPLKANFDEDSQKALERVCNLANVSFE
jgi:hypothetical protein